MRAYHCLSSQCVILNVRRLTPLWQDSSLLRKMTKTKSSRDDYLISQLIYFLEVETLVSLLKLSYEITRIPTPFI